MSSPPRAPRPPAVGDAAPEFKLPTPEGTELGLGELRGRQRVVLWFSKGLF